jgi:hypothetical protein
LAKPSCGSSGLSSWMNINKGNFDQTFVYKLKLHENMFLFSLHSFIFPFEILIYRNFHVCFRDNMRWDWRLGFGERRGRKGLDYYCRKQMLKKSYRCFILKYSFCRASKRVAQIFLPLPSCFQTMLVFRRFIPKTSLPLR